MKVSVITVSDRASRGEYEDLSGPAIAAILEKHYGPSVLVNRTVVPDEPEPLTAALENARESNVIITTGGTGLGPRDITPEVCRTWCDKEVPGVAEALRAHSLNETPMAMLSRNFAGMKDAALVINLPGSVKAVTSCTRFLLPVLAHSAEMIRGGGH